MKNHYHLFTKGEIIFKRVTAQYPTRLSPSVENLTLHIKPSEKIGIVGRTGAGKSTIIKLLAQYLPLKDGQIIIDGLDISRLDLQVLRSQFLLLDQEVVLFDGTIRENIYIHDIGGGSQSQSLERKSDEEIIGHLASFGFSQKILAQEGLDFRIKDNGENLSKGEQQLIALMKAIYTQKKVIILDEATSHIDYQSEQKIMDYFYEQIGDRTLITVAHRVSTLLRCDRIIVLEDGRVKEMGRTQDLLNDQESYLYFLYFNLNDVFRNS